MEFDKRGVQESKNAQDIHNALVTVWGGSECGYSTVARWVADFRSERRTSFEDHEKSVG